MTRHEQFSALGKIGGKASAGVMQQKRLEKWQARGVTPEIGQSIYTAGYMSGYQAAKRRYQERSARISDGSV